jgi:hypothetical protein
MSNGQIKELDQIRKPGALEDVVALGVQYQNR